SVTPNPIAAIDGSFGSYCRFWFSKWLGGYPGLSKPSRLAVRPPHVDDNSYRAGG
ncbi:hypothetical protein U1Q18_015706, partial [Sarracenia purpurea var. burkii]